MPKLTNFFFQIILFHYVLGNQYLCKNYIFTLITTVYDDNRKGT